MPTLLEQLRFITALTGLLVLPGWAALSLSGLWRKWETLQRWIVAVGISIAFYPVLFYGARWLVPRLTLGPYNLAALLLLFFAVAVAWRLRQDWV